MGRPAPRVDSERRKSEQDDFLSYLGSTCKDWAQGCFTRAASLQGGEKRRETGEQGAETERGAGGQKGNQLGKDSSGKHVSKLTS